MPAVSVCHVSIHTTVSRERSYTLVDTIEPRYSVTLPSGEGEPVFSAHCGSRATTWTTVLMWREANCGPNTRVGHSIRPDLI